MAKLKPWFQVVEPREDLKQNRPLDASEFAVHLDHIRTGSAKEVYLNPARFFERTFMTQSLRDLAAQVVRRLSGIEARTNAIFNMATQFGGGKTHALSTLYHLAKGGPAALDWSGVPEIRSEAGVDTIPKAAVAVIVGVELDLLNGRGGTNGEPRRQTLWGEIAWQLGPECFEVVRRHDEERAVPGGDVLSQMLPQGPVLILMDEMMSYVSRARARDAQWRDDVFNFLQIFSETVRARANVVLCVSIPSSDAIEMTPADLEDHDRLRKLLDRLGKAVVITEKTEYAEIIRRRLFDWQGLPEDGRRVAAAYAEGIRENARKMAGFDERDVYQRFCDLYPFHPALLSVFERKWQSLPSFQRTRGVLRLLALWVARAYNDQRHPASREPLLSLGSAPLDDTGFRSATLDQLGESRLAIPVSADISGRSDSHAVTLDELADEDVRRARLHQKVATVIFFESNGGQPAGKDGFRAATMAEIQAGVAAPEVHPLSVEHALEELQRTCFYLTVEGNRYRFGLHPNLNQILVTRRKDIRSEQVKTLIEDQTRALFTGGAKDVDRRFFPRGSADVPDRAALTLVILGRDAPRGEPTTQALVEALVREHGQSGRTFKSALFFLAPAAGAAVAEAAQTLLAWRAIADEVDRGGEDAARLTEAQRGELDRSKEKAEVEFETAVAQSYGVVTLLDRQGRLKHVDVQEARNEASKEKVEVILARLLRAEEITEGFAPGKLLPLWPPALPEWPTRAVRDAFYASPALPRPRREEVVRRCIAEGVSKGIFALGSRGSDGALRVERFAQPLESAEVKLTEELLLLKAEQARALLEAEAQRVTEEERRAQAAKPGVAAEEGAVTGAATPAPGTPATAAGDVVPPATPHGAAGTTKHTTPTAGGTGTAKPRSTVGPAPGGLGHFGGLFTGKPSSETPAQGTRRLTLEADIPYDEVMDFVTKGLGPLAVLSDGPPTLHVRVEVVAAQPFDATKLRAVRDELEDLLGSEMKLKLEP